MTKQELEAQVKYFNKWLDWANKMGSKSFKAINEKGEKEDQKINMARQKQWCQVNLDYYQEQLSKI